MLTLDDLDDGDTTGPQRGDTSRFRDVSSAWAELPPLGEWAMHARCSGLPQETADFLFFPERRESRQTLALTRRFCSECPVQADCRAYAREHKPAGRWGGETEGERDSHRLRWLA